MSGLNALFNKQKSQAFAPDDGAKQKDSTDGPKADESPKSTGHERNQASGLAGFSKPKAKAEPKAESSDQKDSGQVKAKPSGIGALGAAAKKAKDSTDSATPTPSGSGLTLDSLSKSKETGVAPTESKSTPRFLQGEVPATAPIRELPEDTPEEARQFLSVVDNVYAILDDPDMFENVIKDIMSQMQQHPEYLKLLSPDDKRTFIVGMRENMGLAKIAKAQKKSGGAKKVSVKNAQLMDDLASMGLDLESMGKS